MCRSAVTPRMQVRVVLFHSFLWALCGDFGDVARFMLLQQLDAGPWFGGKNSPVLMQTVDTVLKLTWGLGVPIALLLDRMRRPHLLERLGIVTSLICFALLAVTPTNLVLTPCSLIVGAEVGIVIWACTTDAMSIKARDRLAGHADAATLQVRKLACVALGVSLASEFGGIAAQYNPNPRVVFGVSALMLLACALMMPLLPEKDDDVDGAMPPPAIQTIKSIGSECGSWLLLSNAASAIPQTNIAVMFFLTRVRGFTPMQLGTLMAATAAATALASALAEKVGMVADVAPFWACLVSGVIASFMAYTLVALPDTSVEAESVPSWIEVGALPLQIAAQAAMSVPCCAAIARSLADRGERRAFVTTVVYLFPVLGSILSGPSAVLLCRVFGVSHGDPSGVIQILQITATLVALTILAIPSKPHDHSHSHSHAHDDDVDEGRALVAVVPVVAAGANHSGCGNSPHGAV